MRLAVVLAGVVLTGLPVVASAADGQLATTKLQKSALACQKVIAQVSAKVLAGKFAALDACANAALACVQTKQDQGDCLGKARQMCVKKLNGATLALAKAQTKIEAAKSCGKNLSLTDLLSSDGLGLGHVAGACSAEFDLNVCEGLDSLAKCLAQTHDQAAGALYGQVRPDTGDLLTRLVALPEIAGLPASTPCATCSVTPGHRKAVEQCGRALTKATGALAAALDTHFSACAQSVLACAQAGATTPGCLPKASTGCDQHAQKVAFAVAKFAGAVGKKCGAETIAFDELKVAPGINLATFDACAALELSPATDAETLAACLKQRTTCAVSGLVQQSVARVGEFGEQNELGALGEHLAATCPTLVAPPSIKTIQAARFNFGSSILKFLKRVQLPSGGIVKSVPTGGGIPHPSGAGRGVTSIHGPARVHFGETVKIPFTYRSLPMHASQSRLAAGSLTLIVAVRRDDLTIDDYFEIPLTRPSDGTETRDDLEVVYQDKGTLTACAFTLALATRDGNDVSEYAPLLQVVDATQTPSPLPTTTPSAPSITEIIDGSGDGAGHALDQPYDLAVDGDGNVYVVGQVSRNAFKIAPGGEPVQIIDVTGDGAGHTLNDLLGVTVDGDGNVFVSDDQNDNVFRISPAGAITRVIGPLGDGAGNTLDGPLGLTTDSDGNLYVAGAGSDNVFQVTPAGVVTKLIDASGDGAGHALNSPSRIAVDGAHNVYVCGNFTDNAFKIAFGGPITQIIDASGDGLGHTLNDADGIAVDGIGNVYVVGNDSNNVFKITSGGTITRIIDATGDGVGHLLQSPGTIAVDSAGNVYVGGIASDNVFKITPKGVISRIIGASGDGTGNTLDQPSGIAVDSAGNVYVAGRTTDNVFKIVPGS